MNEVLLFVLVGDGCLLACSGRDARPAVASSPIAPRAKDELVVGVRSWWRHTPAIRVHFRLATIARIDPSGVVVENAPSDGATFRATV